MGPEGLRNLPKLTQQADMGWLFQETVYSTGWLGELGKLVTML